MGNYRMSLNQFIGYENNFRYPRGLRWPNFYGGSYPGYYGGGYPSFYGGGYRDGGDHNHSYINPITKGNLVEFSNSVLLTPDECTIICIDHQPQMAFAVHSIDVQLLKNNVVALAKTANVFKVPVILTAIDPKTFSGYTFKELTDVLPNVKPIERSEINAWENIEFVQEVKRVGRRKLIMCALWTEACLCFPVLCALKDGYEVYFVVDASGGASETSHKIAIDRMIQAGAIPVTWQQVMFEFQRDWAHIETTQAVLDIAKEHSGTYGLGIEYAETMLK